MFDFMLPHFWNRSILPSFCGVALSSSPLSLSVEQRYPFFFRMLQMRMPSRPMMQNTGTKANTAYSAVFSSAVRTTVPFTGAPAPPDGPFPTVRICLFRDAARREPKLNRRNANMRNALCHAGSKPVLTFSAGTLNGKFLCSRGLKPTNGGKKKKEKRGTETVHRG